MPGNMVSRFAAMICSTRTYVRVPTSHSRGSTGGTLMRAKRSSPSLTSRTVTASDSDRSLM